MKIIYCIYNDIDRNVYIGKTGIGLKKRMREHKIERFKERSRWKPLYSAMNKIGVDKFHIKELEVVDDEDAGEREKHWIELYRRENRAYNIAAGGDGRPKYDRRKIVEELKKERNPRLVAEKLGCSIDTASTIAKDSGIELEELKKRRAHWRALPVCQFSIDGEKVLEHWSLTSAADWCMEHGKSRGKSNSFVAVHIRECAEEKRKTAYGYMWKFKNG